MMIPNALDSILSSARIASLVALTGAVALAQGGFQGPGRYEITNLKSGKVIDLDRNDQTTVIQFASRGTDNQQWDIEQAGGGYYVFRNAMNGNALEASGTGNASPVRGTRFHGGPSQQWRIDNGKDGNAVIVSRLGKALDIPDGTSRDGVRIQIYEPNGDSNQRFTLRRIGRGLYSQPGARGRDGYDRGPAGDRDHPQAADRSGRYYDSRDRMWKLSGDGACFYPMPNYGGQASCARLGEDRATLGADASDAFGSVKLFGRARSVDVFEREDYDGRRFRITRDEPDLGRVRMGWGSGVVGSFRVF